MGCCEVEPRLESDWSPTPTRARRVHCPHAVVKRKIGQIAKMEMAENAMRHAVAA